MLESLMSFSVYEAYWLPAMSYHLSTYNVKIIGMRHSGAPNGRFCAPLDANQAVFAPNGHFSTPLGAVDA